jgi:PIN domain nuclease of toxin-antitoxin system
MRLLLDTHTALWLTNNHERLSPQAKSIINNDENTLHLSIVSAWEIVIKTSTKKLSIDGGIIAFLRKVEEMPITTLSITPRHLEILETLPFIHRDPFDRLLIAIAKAEDMTILTMDENIKKYEVSSVW